MSIKKLLNKLTKYFIKPNWGNNTVNIAPSAYLRKVKIKIHGENNFVDIADNTYLHNVKIKIGFPDCPINNCRIKIGKSTSFNSADIQLGESNSILEIGENCMFSFNIELSCSDTHSIFNSDNEITNIGKEILIGSNVWVGKDVKILKNTKVPSGCIVAQGSLVTKKFEEENAVIAGNPAKVVKKNIRWNRIRPQNYLNNKENNQLNE